MTEKTVPPVVASVIRTFVPYVVGYVLTLAAQANLDLPEEMATEVVAIALATLYYALVRILETRGKNAWGWLLGLARQPTYEATAKVDHESPTGESAAPSSEVAEVDEPVESTAVVDGSATEPIYVPAQPMLLRTPPVDDSPPGVDEPEVDEIPSELFGTKPSIQDL